VNLSALLSRFEQDLAHPGWVGADPARHVGATSMRSVSPLAIACARISASTWFSKLQQVDRLRNDLQLARFELRDVEDVVEDREQVCADSRAVSRLDRLLRREAAVLQQRHHAEHAVERRADLVTHVREERAFARFAASAPWRARAEALGQRLEAAAPFGEGAQLVAAR
jgi:hypothetical protein